VRMAANPNPHVRLPGMVCGEEDEQMDCGWGSTEAEAICDLADNYSRPR
jgi:hypothetical protein